ncbi:V-type ATP synthase subunit C [Peptoniphilus equinus]|uniref:V-type ATP synthase subunit C n=1 Tax=Peptoniphilus equinus TaxID=3016343 RepID=A0ABY7QU03_9FIRM|nr:V-type ATP synthase subunit C [Peptoniphilus equinus]WBW49846.1 V-type ATP synthase subunit C [Peptoniphilus equinus]
MKREAFVQASVQTRIYEKNLLSDVDFKNFIEAKTVEGLINSLGDTVYKEEAMKLRSVDDYDKALENVLIGFYNTMYDIAHDDDVIDLLALKYVYHNLKVAAKEQLLHEDLSHLYYPIKGDVQAIKASLNEFSDNAYATVLQGALETFELTKDPQDVDIYLDNAYFDAIKALAKESQVELFETYVRDLVDFTNIATTLRLRRRGDAQDLLAKALIDGGMLDLGTLNHFYESEDTALLTRVNFRKYLDEGLKAYKETGSMAEFEKAKDNYFMALIKNYKHTTYGPEILFNYLYARETEIKNIRLIFIGLLNGTDEDVLRQRLRDTYV